MKKLTFEKKLLLAFLLLGLLCALILCGIRMGIEAKNDRVCIAMPAADLQLLAERSGLPDAEAAAEELGVQIMEPETLKNPGMLVEDVLNAFDVPVSGAYVPDGENTRVFLMDGEYAERYAAFGYDGTQPIEDMLYRAVTERNIRLLYLRLFETETGEPVTEIAEYRTVTEHLTGRIAAHGLTVAEAPSTIAPYAPAGALRYLTAVGILSAALLLLLCLFPKLPAKWTCVLLVLGEGGTGLLMAARPALFTAVFAFAASVIAPCLALMLTLRYAKRTAAETRLGELGGFALSVLTGFAIALAGGLMIAALQSGSEWLLAVKTFRGVKLSQLLPLAFAALLALREICPLKKLLRGRAFVTVICAAVILVCVGYFLLRSGNAVFAVSDAEQQFRAWLENVRIVRPRTKEFLIGWPCLALCMAALRRGYKRIAVPLYVFSAVSLSSAVNTFCHSRSPVWISSVRGVLGALIGCAVGMVLLSLLTSLPLRKNKTDN